MRALAFVVGNAKYVNNLDPLKNAVNDADAVAEKLLNLGFMVEKLTDCTNEEFEKGLHKFGEKLVDYDAGLFYFAGHGVQIDNINYLMQIDTRCQDPYSLKNHALKLNEVMDRMEGSGVKTKILILDACRENPFVRGVQSGLAPIFAPKGTLIAFSTSPGETASDGGGDNHSIYTYAFLKHIEDKNTRIEEFFKRVRTTVYSLSGGRQTSWEHTSLIGDFYFNSGQMVNSSPMPYAADVVADGNFSFGDSPTEKIIKDIKERDWYTQNPAIEKLRDIKPSSVSSDLQFLLGRNLLQAATGGAHRAEDFFNYLEEQLGRWSAKGENHVLNGILFEMYFNHEGKFRNGEFKSEMVNSVMVLEGNEKYRKSFEFIQEQLLPLRDFLRYIPNPDPESLPIELILKNDSIVLFEKPVPRILIDKLMINGEDQYNHLPKEDVMFKRTDIYEIKRMLSKEICVSISRLRITSNMDGKLDDVEISIPLYSSLLK